MATASWSPLSRLDVCRDVQKLNLYKRSYVGEERRGHMLLHVIADVDTLESGEARVKGSNGFICIILRRLDSLENLKRRLIILDVAVVEITSTSEPNATTTAWGLILVSGKRVGYIYVTQDSTSFGQ